MSWKIAVANQKGGVAKTTTAISVAAFLQGEGRQVLAIDLDPQANLTLGLGVPPDDCRGRSAYDLLTGAASIADVATRCAGGGPDVIPSEMRLARAEKELYGEIGFDEILGRKLAGAGGYESVVLDCPPSLGVLTANALSCADVVLIPVQCEFFAARGLLQILDVIDVVRERRNPGLTYRIVPSLFDARNRICKGILEQLRRSFGERVTRTVIGVDTKLREASAAGVPISRYAPASRGASQYAQLVEEVLRHEAA